jgi:phosphate transport system substrate-binding protein
MQLKLALLALGLAVPIGLEAKTLKVNGSTTVNLPAAEAAELLRIEMKMDIQVDTQGGSSGGVSAVGDGLAQIGMSSKQLTTDDRKKYPTIKFKEFHIGEDAVALVVSKDVWDSGIRALTKVQIRDIYEGRIVSWATLGGLNRRIVFFNKEPGRGTWEVFAKWLYGDPKIAAQVNFPEVGGNEETRLKVSATRGAISQLSSSWADGKTVFALSIKTETNETISPTFEAIASHRYPMSRPLFLLTNGEPSGDTKVFIDFLLSERGQGLVRKHGYLSLAQLHAH